MIEDCYRSLFAAILHQAMVDAATPVSPRAKNYAKNNQRDAHAFIFEPNELFDLACAVTDYDRDGVRERTRKMIAEAQTGKTARTRFRNQGECQPKRQVSKRYELNGETLMLHQWAERYGIEHRFVYARVRRGWPLLAALTTPPSRRSKRDTVASVAPGEGQDLAPQLGTGGGSDAQERAKTEFAAQKEIEPCL